MIAAARFIALQGVNMPVAQAAKFVVLSAAERLDALEGRAGRAAQVALQRLIISPYQSRNE